MATSMPLNSMGLPMSQPTANAMPTLTPAQEAYLSILSPEDAELYLADKGFTDLR
jgi:hypothetical protein